MAKGTTEAKRSWRDIQQGGAGAQTTRVSRQRRLRLALRSITALLVIGLIITGMLTIRYMGERLPPVAAVQPAAQLELDFGTNGVLDEKWFRQNFANFLQTDIRAVNVHEVKAAVESFGQIAEATVSVSFPRLLRVQVNEREPVLRVRVRDVNGQPATLLIARDGHLYQGFNYPTESLRNLPGAAGLKLTRGADGSFLPISDISEVADLLDAARIRLPSVYRHWRIVHLQDWQSGGGLRRSLVHIESAQMARITFALFDIEEQLRRLELILDHAQRQQIGQPRSIDLSFATESVVRYP